MIIKVLINLFKECTVVQYELPIFCNQLMLFLLEFSIYQIINLEQKYVGDSES